MLTSSIRNRIQSRRQTNLRMLVYYFSCLCLCLCLCLSTHLCVYLRITVRECINAWVTDPRAQSLNSDLMQS